MSTSTRRLRSLARNAPLAFSSGLQATFKTKEIQRNLHIDSRQPIRSALVDLHGLPRR